MITYEEMKELKNKELLQQRCEEEELVQRLFVEIVDEVFQSEDGSIHFKRDSMKEVTFNRLQNVLRDYGFKVEESLSPISQYLWLRHTTGLFVSLHREGGLYV